MSWTEINTLYHVDYTRLYAKKNKIGVIVLELNTNYYKEFTGRLENGTEVEVNGNDLFHFKGNKIYIKDSYRKNRTK